ncbi:MAG: flagellar protein FlgN [Candidatus Gastranaerophilales bacterium]|jgi:flagellar biosynthesis/type III secretory pathway chaperone|nr:flagellar protein FlgN [Candidatus Gastranaerophilales bacterium]
MKQYLDKVEDIINKEIKAYGVLEELLQEKTDIIMKSDMDGLENIDSKIVEQTTSVANLVRARQNQCIYIERIDLTFSEIVNKAFEVDQAQGQRLNEKRTCMEELIGKVRHQNNINAKLIQNSLTIMNRTVDFVLKMIAPELDSYNQRGQMNKLNDNYKISSIEQEA